MAKGKEEKDPEVFEEEGEEKEEQKEEEIEDFTEEEWNRILERYNQNKK